MLEKAADPNRQANRQSWGGLEAAQTMQEQPPYTYGVPCRQLRPSRRSEARWTPSLSSPTTSSYKVGPGWRMVLSMLYVNTVVQACPGKDGGCWGLWARLRASPCRMGSLDKFRVCKSAHPCSASGEPRCCMITKSQQQRSHTCPACCPVLLAGACGPAHLTAELWGTATGMQWQALLLCCAESDCCAHASARFDPQYCLTSWLQHCQACLQCSLQADWALMPPCKLPLSGRRLALTTCTRSCAPFQMCCANLNCSSDQAAG